MWGRQTGASRSNDCYDTAIPQLLSLLRVVCPSCYLPHVPALSFLICCSTPSRCSSPITFSQHREHSTQHITHSTSAGDSFKGGYGLGQHG
jgi:hypothetical protein